MGLFKPTPLTILTVVRRVWRGSLPQMRAAALVCAMVGASLYVTPALAQGQTANLIADRVTIEGNTLVATGSVEVLYDGSRLRATSISYNKSNDQLTIQGPITVVYKDGTILVAQSGALSADMRNGVLKSARIVMDQQLQIAASQIKRSGRYTQMDKITASSCQVCQKNPVPLWQIRAKRVVHDEAEHQLYFYGAQFRVGDVPVMYLPRLRLPDPTLQRATGFLAPKLRLRSSLGSGILIPFFLRLGDHADVTLSPFLASKTKTLELKYRHAFAAGDVEVTGAISDDSLLPDQTRYFLFAKGSFSLPREFTLNFELHEVSDEAYLLDYGYSSQDRLRNSVNVFRARRDEFIFAGITRFDTLRESEISIADQLPFAQIDALYERRFFPNFIQGELRANLSWQAHFRESTDDIVGRDMARFGAGLSWYHDWTSTNGIVFKAETALNANTYWIDQDSRYTQSHGYLNPSAGLTLRWPMSRNIAGGAQDIIEPIAQLAWSDHLSTGLPNEDSQYVEFDEGNLLDLNRFPGHDQQEDGLRGALGLNWTRHTPSGWAFNLSVGRVFHQKTTNEFSDASGLSGQRSDWLLGAAVSMGNQAALKTRALIDDNFNVTKAETQASYFSDDLQLSATHIWVIQDVAEDRSTPTHELSLSTGYQMNDYWKISADGNFDLQANEATSAALGLEYKNECVLVDVSLSRRFTSSSSVTPTTDFGLSVELTGFGGARNGRSGRKHNCSP